MARAAEDLAASHRGGQEACKDAELSTHAETVYAVKVVVVVGLRGGMTLGSDIFTCEQM